jgi:hypothetical protein
MQELVSIIRSGVAPVGVAGRNVLPGPFMNTNVNLRASHIVCAVALGMGSLFGAAVATERIW